VLAEIAAAGRTAENSLEQRIRARGAESPSHETPCGAFILRHAWARPVDDAPKPGKRQLRGSTAEKKQESVTEHAFYVITFVATREMIMRLKITPIGNSFGVILPREALAKLKVTGGDNVFITETPDGFRITPYDPEFEAQMNLARRVMKKRRNALRQLAS
jgi:putative addiction module antidote